MAAVTVRPSHPSGVNQTDGCARPSVPTSVQRLHPNGARAGHQPLGARGREAPPASSTLWGCDGAPSSACCAPCGSRPTRAIILSRTTSTVTPCVRLEDADRFGAQLSRVPSHHVASLELRSLAEAGARVPSLHARAHPDGPSDIARRRLTDTPARVLGVSRAIATAAELIHATAAAHERSGAEKERARHDDGLQRENDRNHHSPGGASALFELPN